MEECNFGISFLGSVRIDYSSDKLKFLRTQKARGLLYYLITESVGYSSRKFPREKLADLFWPGITQSSALENLRQAIYQIRKAIPEVTNELGDQLVPLLDNVQKALVIHPQARVNSDIRAFQDGLRPWKSMKQKENAIKIYQGDFLTDFSIPDCPGFDNWIDGIRASLRYQFLSNLDGLIKHYLGLHENDKTLEYIQLYLKYEPGHESPYISWIQLLLYKNQRSEALQVYHRCVDVLERELGIEPGKDIQKLFEQIKHRAIESTIIKPVDEQEMRVAVLPFKNLSKSADQDYLADGFMTDIITYISKIKGLRLISRDSVMYYQNSSKSIKEIGAELGLLYVLEGSVQMIANQIKITVQWIDLKSDHYFWADSFIKGFEEIFNLQSEVAQTVALQLKIKTGNSIEQKESSIAPVPAKAYDVFLKGRYAFFKAYPEALNQAMKYYTEAVRIAPNFCLAYLEIACTYGSMISWWGDKRLLEVQTNFYQALDKARNLPDYQKYEGYANGLLGWTKMWEYNLKEAEQSFLKSIEEEGILSWTYPGLAQVYNVEGKHDQAIVIAQKGLENDPLLPQNYVMLAEGYFLRKQYQEALIQAQHARELAPDYFPGLATYSWICTNIRDFDQAMEVCEQSMERNQLRPYYILGRLGQAYAYAQQVDKANAILREMLTEHQKGRKGFPYFMALIYMALGDESKALDWLDKGFQDQDTDLIWLKVQPEFQAIRQHPRFKTLLDRF